MSLKSKRFTDKWVAALERDERAAISIARRSARIWPASKVAGAASRRDPLADERIFLAIKRSLDAGHDTIMMDGRRPLVRKGRKPIYVLKPDEESEDGTITRRIWTPDWAHTGDRLKLFAMGASLEGPSLTINIRLGPKAIRAGLASRRGFGGYLSERMTRLLKHGGDPSPLYAFMIEASPAHDLHLHGIIQTPIGDLTRILAEVGREIDMRKERQVKVEPVTNMVGWARYIAKAPLVTAEALSYARRRAGLEARDDGLIGASLSLRRAGREWYRAMRASNSPL
ncbi:MAG: hypothetical protein U9R70_07555 [Pseudomonadota bacterium]|nr:hypothetical protein [Pseudomonadota bacterium]